MLRIRKVNDARTPANLSAVQAAQQIMREQFSGLAAEDVEKLPDQLDNPFRYQFISELLIAEDARGQVKGFALIMHDPDLSFSYLEIISTPQAARPGSGVGGALYDRVREECRDRGSKGLYFECLPDQPDKSPDPQVRKQNIARLRFYERYGARPISGIEYDRPISPGDTDMPYLVFDGLGERELPDAKTLRRIVRAILTRKYAELCPPEYVKAVLASIRPDGFALREPVHHQLAASATAQPLSTRPLIPLITSELHDIHHVRERGYVEAPVRINTILNALNQTGLFEQQKPKSFPARYLREVHDADLLRYLEQACNDAPLKRSVYPYVFPVRNEDRRPVDKSVLAGYYCIDTFTPINRNAWPAARAAVDCALTAAEQVVSGARAAYALVRPPGHHAERDTFGGFCYLSNGAIAANYLSHYGRVAMLDIDYHHGNGQQDIFYQRNDVLTVSIHGDPSFAYPYFTGFRNEAGSGDGAGYNINIPLPETLKPGEYLRALKLALKRIEQFRPAYLVVL
ncbi:MAG: hypothetical protein WBD51_17620, partial [Burkholderiaceae bacterium]